MFIPIFRDHAILPSAVIDENGVEQIIASDFYYPKTPLDRLNVLDLSYMLYVLIALSVITIVFAIISIFSLDNSKTKRIHRFFFVLVSAAFIILFFISSFQVVN